MEDERGWWCCPFKFKGSLGDDINGSALHTAERIMVALGRELGRPPTNEEYRALADHFRRLAALVDTWASGSPQIDAAEKKVFVAEEETARLLGRLNAVRAQLGLEHLTGREIAPLGLPLEATEVRALVERSKA